MITVTYGATLHIDDALAPLNELWQMQPDEPEWYWSQRTNILYRLQEDMEDDLNKCDPNIERVCIDHLNWISCEFDIEDHKDLPKQIRKVKRKVQEIIDWAIAEYPKRLKQFHDDLIADGVEIPVDVCRP